MRDTCFRVRIIPELGKVKHCEAIDLVPSWYPTDDPDDERWPGPNGSTMFYPGPAVRALKAWVGDRYARTWLVPPSEWVALFEAMGWDPNVVCVEAAYWEGGTVYAIVST